MPPRKKRYIIRKKKRKVHNSAIIIKRKASTKSNQLEQGLGKELALEKPVTNTIYCQKEAVGLDRLVCPYNQFRITRPSVKKNKMSNYGNSKKEALTPQERTFLLCSCRRLNRYHELKNHAQEAIKRKKIFIIHGHCDYVRRYLVERGWVEKIPPERMDVNSLRCKKHKDDAQINFELERLLLSNLVERYAPHFIWNAKDYFDITKDKDNSNAFHNRLKQEAAWTSKQGLCSSIKQNHWYYIQGMAEVAIPRTYVSFNEGEKDDFDEDYKLTACTSLLKWVLSMIANGRPVFSISGSIGLNVMIFALNRCKEFIFDKQHKYLDSGITTAVTSGQWNSFLKKYYILIAKQDTFKLDTENKLPIYVEYAKFLLKEISRYRPQLTCEGCHNVWIIKPTHMSRGRGIRLASKLGVLKDLHNRGKYVFQKYIEEPLLIHDTKFDIRQYYLISSTVPLVIWMYKDCYLKFSSQKYSLKNYHEAIHLTNNAVQRKYQNCADRHPELPHNNMWSLDTYKSYLRNKDKEHLWDEVIYPGMKKSIVGSMLTCQDTIIYNKNRFELYGCDFILDKDYKPWLIEINSCPDLNPTTKVTAEICPAVISDMIKVVIDYSADHKASTGKFECIYRESPYQPRAGVGELVVRGYSLPTDYFYKGKDLLLEEYNDANIGILPNTINSELLTLAEYDYSSNNNQQKKKAEVNNLKSITSELKSQLNWVLDKMTSKNSRSIQRNSFVSSPSSNNVRLSNGFNSSAVNIRTFVDKNGGRFASQAALSPTNLTEPCFGFSQLDDGPFGNGSGVINGTVRFDKRVKDYLYAASNNVTPYNVAPNNKTKNEAFKLTSNALEATKKLILFLERKQEEYSND